MRDPTSNFDRILIRSIDDSQLVHLTLGTNRHEAMPEWSPDGTRIVFERIVQNECSMFVASSLGGGEREVGPCNNDYIVNYYDWSPDGKSLITAQSRDGATGVQSLMRWSLDTGERQFLDYPRRADDVDVEPHYSPDGRLIAFRRGLAPYSDLFVMDAAGGAPRQVTHIAARIRGYAWARDSKHARRRVEFPGTDVLVCRRHRQRDAAAARHLARGISARRARNADGIVYEIPRTRDLSWLTCRFVPERHTTPSRSRLRPAAISTAPCRRRAIASCSCPIAAVRCSSGSTIVRQRRRPH